MKSTAPLQTICKACGKLHPIEPSQFPPGVLELLQYDNGLIWSKDLIGHCWRNRAEPADYPGAMADLKAAFSKLNAQSKVLTVGSMSPWIEAICEAQFQIVVTDVHPIRIFDNSLLSYFPPDVAYNPDGGYDLIIAYSSIEHFGLGRYGDDLDPDADKKWMRMIRDCIAPGGRLLLAVPLGPVGKVEECWHRIYGPVELAALLEGWKIDSITRAGRKFDNPPFEVTPGMLPWQNQPLLSLEAV
jgi:hypothetical protein